MNRKDFPHWGWNPRRSGATHRTAGGRGDARKAQRRSTVAEIATARRASGEREPGLGIGCACACHLPLDLRGGLLHAVQVFAPTDTAQGAESR